MIHFFRQIRQHLLTDNKFRKYLLYAIGEIALVVIGILIALQIDTWNEDKIRDQVVKRHLNSLSRAIEHDIREMGISMGFNEFRYHSWQYLLELAGIPNDSLEEIPIPDSYIVSPWDKPYPDTADQAFIAASMKQINDAFLGMIFNYSAIREINNLGIISDMDNDSLKVKINEYYYHLDWKFGEQSVTNRHKLAEDLKTYLRDSHAISCNYPPDSDRIFEVLRENKKAAIMLKDLTLMANRHYWVTSELQLMAKDLVEMIRKEMNEK